MALDEDVLRDVVSQVRKPLHEGYEALAAAVADRRLSRYKRGQLASDLAKLERILNSLVVIANAPDMPS